MFSNHALYIYIYILYMHIACCDLEFEFVSAFSVYIRRQAGSRCLDAGDRCSSVSPWRLESQGTYICTYTVHILYIYICIYSKYAVYHIYVLLPKDTKCHSVPLFPGDSFCPTLQLRVLGSRASHPACLHPLMATP